MARPALDGAAEVFGQQGERGRTGSRRRAWRIAHGCSRGASRAVGLGIVDLGNGRCPRVGAIDKEALGLVLDHAVHTDQATIQQIYDVRRTIEMRTVAFAALQLSASAATKISFFINPTPHYDSVELAFTDR